MILDRQQIKTMLPHREPFLFVDAVKSVDEGKSVEAELFLDPALPFFAGHFPGEPIMPGVLTCEALAQTAGLLLGLSAAKDGNASGPKIFYLASANIKYREPVLAGETLTMRAWLAKDFQGLAQFRVEALSGKTRVAEGTLVLASREDAKR